MKNKRQQELMKIIDDIRRSRRMSIQHLCEGAGVTSMTYNRAKAGCNMTFSTLHSIAQAVGADIDIVSR